MKLHRSGKAIPLPHLKKLLIVMTSFEARSHHNVRKCILAMKLTAFVILVAVLHVSAGTYSQKVTVKGKDILLTEVFKSIRKQTGLQFVYLKEVIKETKPVTLNLQDVELQEVLKECLAPQKLTFEITDKIISITAVATGLKRLGLEAFTTEEIPPIKVSGTVVGVNNQPLSGATVRVKGKNIVATSDERGYFELTAEEGSVLLVSYVGFQQREYKISAGPVIISLVQVDSRMDTAEVVLNTGYQVVPKERATGSFVHVNNELYNRRTSGNVLDRLEGVTSGLVFNKDKTFQSGQSSMTIRGRSTILGNAEPLIVLDNFPYEGNINSLNPNDIESVTILRDAAAASIWGSRAGNGVIVITTKKGKLNQRPAVSVNSNVTVSEKPDLFYAPQMSMADYVDIEKFLFSKGAYDLYLQFIPYYFFSPVIDVLWQQKQNAITEAQANEKIAEISRYDIRNDLTKYVYQRAINQQYAINISGGNDWSRYYYSVGYDRNRGSITKTESDRISFTGRNTFVLIKNRLEVNTGIIFSKSKNVSTLLPLFKTPYGRLKDESGNNLAIGGDLRQSYVDTAGGGKLLDWSYRLLDDLDNVNYKDDIIDLLANSAVKLSIIKGLDAQLLYQYGRGSFENTGYYSQESYYARNLINQFSQINAATGQVTYGLPKGAILDRMFTQYESNNIRGQLNFNRHFSRHSISALAGVERRTLNTLITPDQRLYGFDPDVQTYTNIDFQKTFPVYYSGGLNTLPGSTYGTLRQERNDNNISYFFNSAYSFDNRYTISFSARKDESNIFGVNSNQKGVPLYSVGASWNISAEQFYKATWLPVLKIRITSGYNGNVDKSTAAYLTASAYTNSFGQPASYINNPPNPDLRWEKIMMNNLAVDFATRQNRISGSFEYFFKNGKDMIGNGLLVPSSGLTQFRGNTADIKGRGFDLILNSINVDGAFGWSTNLLLSYATDEVASYKLKPSFVSRYMGFGINPVEGKPVYSIFSYPWGGLDPETGDPLGMLDGKPSSEYNKISGTSDFNTLIYNGPANPTYTGSIRNSLTFKNIDLSFNIIGKFGYYFKRPSLNYSNMMNVPIPIDIYNPDYSRRWKQAGDEAFTNVPSMVYPNISGRSEIYNNSEILVSKGDHIRLQDIQLSYSIKNKLTRLGMSAVHIYAYVNNLGILWRANKYGVDPDFLPRNLVVYPATRTYAVGANIEF